MMSNNIVDLKTSILENIQEIENQIDSLVVEDPLFGLVSMKHVKCGKKNCKCAHGEKFYHGPYYYLRLEPDYKYRKYLGKKVPGSIQDRLEVGHKIKELEKKKKKFTNSLRGLEGI
ncbi:MAG: DUF6788 family protein [Candidatus Heimdallarchaeaceae archaeon]